MPGIPAWAEQKSVIYICLFTFIVYLQAVYLQLSHDMKLGAVHLLRNMILAYSRLPPTPCNSVIFCPPPLYHEIIERAHMSNISFS